MSFLSRPDGPGTVAPDALTRGQNARALRVETAAIDEGTRYRPPPRAERLPDHVACGGSGCRRAEGHGRESPWTPRCNASNRSLSGSAWRARRPTVASDEYSNTARGGQYPVATRRPRDRTDDCLVYRGSPVCTCPLLRAAARSGPGETGVDTHRRRAWNHGGGRPVSRTIRADEQRGTTGSAVPTASGFGGHLPSSRGGGRSADDRRFASFRVVSRHRGRARRERWPRLIN